MKKRTAKDEADYIEELVREEPIKTEVIVELRDQAEWLLKDRVVLLENLIAAQDALRVYRLAALEQTKQVAGRRHDCVPGCRRHTWNNVDGWHRTPEAD